MYDANPHITEMMLIDVIQDLHIDVVHVDEMIEGFDSHNQVPEELMRALYAPDRTWSARDFKPFHVLHIDSVIYILIPDLRCVSFTLASFRRYDLIEVSVPISIECCKNKRDNLTIVLKNHWRRFIVVLKSKPEAMRCRKKLRVLSFWRISYQIFYLFFSRKLHC